MLRSSLLRAFANPRPLSQCRSYSSALANVDASKLTISETRTPGLLQEPEKLVFGNTFTDHMLSLEWSSLNGWSNPKITPYQPLTLDPATCVFHYGFSCFEGLKAYRSSSSSLLLFRPDRNMARLNKSAQRIALPAFDPAAMVELLKTFVALEEKFVPNRRGYSLYLRPTMIGTQRTLGVGPPGSALLFVIASPVGPYYPTGFKAVSLQASSKYVRAWPGGVGNAKLGGNYAPCVVPQLEAASRGYHQNLWLFGEEGYVTEVGTMNLFTLWKTRDGVNEIVTAPLDGTILEGVTRDCILDLAREFLVPEGWRVSERKYTITEVVEAEQEGRLLEVFGTGTAAVVSPVKMIEWDGREIGVPLQEGKEAGPVAERMARWMEERQYGDVKSDWSFEVPKIKT